MIMLTIITNFLLMREVLVKKDGKDDSRLRPQENVISIITVHSGGRAMSSVNMGRA